MLAAATRNRYRFPSWTQSGEIVGVLSDPNLHVDAVVVDLTRQPVAHEQRVGLVRNHHALFPGLRVIVATNNRRLADAVRRGGADAVVAAPADGTAVAAAYAALPPIP